jgi:hypothetical protein
LEKAQREVREDQERIVEGRRSKGRRLTERRRKLLREMDRGTMKSMG